MMRKRFVSIWFRYLKTDWFSRRDTALKQLPFVLAFPDHGRMLVTEANALAEAKGIYQGMVVADARAIVPALKVLDDNPKLPTKLLEGIARWFIRYTPVVAVDPPDNIILDATGCAHLWGGENEYLSNIIKRLKNFGYAIKASMADTIGVAWAVAHFSQSQIIVEHGQQKKALLALPPAALRLEPDIIERLQKLGLRQLSNFIDMPRSALRRRFGLQILTRIDQALGYEEEIIQPVESLEPYHERLPCLEPIITATGIEIALQRLLGNLCDRFQREQKGLRKAIFKCYRVDGKIKTVQIGTNHPSSNCKHIFKLFELKLDSIEPALGIELFTLEAPQVEDALRVQEKLWDNTGDLNDIALAELLDRIEGKVGPNCIHRYMPDEHYWPERSFKEALSLGEKLQTTWKVNRPRPLKILSVPESITVISLVPDYPPTMFRYKDKSHKIIKADGPERIEQEWWIEEGEYRDYYYVEDEDGKRYWLFRLGHFNADKSYQWFIHGFFA
jgi:protein ImuB